MSGYEIATVILAEFCIVLATIAVVLFYLLRAAKRNINELRAHLKLNKGSVDDYEKIIAKELQRTKLRLKNLLQRDRLPNEAMLVTRLRANFLSAEQHARAYRDNQEAFWKALEEGLKDMIALAKIKVDKTSGDEQAAWQQKLEESEKKIQELEMARGTFSAPRKAMEQARDDSEELVQLRELKVQHLEKIEKLILQVAELRSAHLNAELPSKAASTNIDSEGVEPPLPASSDAPPAQTVFIRSMQEVKYAQSAMADTLQQIDTYQSNNTREIGRLKEMCLQQRTIIKELREQINLRKNGEAENNTEAVVQHTNNIERLLRDAEMCVQTLEQENANLHSEITTLRTQAAIPDEVVTVTDEMDGKSKAATEDEKSTDYYVKQIHQFRERIRELDQLGRLNQQLRTFTVKSLECQTSNALVELLSLTLSQFELTGCLQAKVSGKVMTTAFGNQVENKDNNLLNSIVVERAVTALADNTIYAIKPLKILIKPNNAQKGHQLTSAHILELTELCAMRFDALSAREKLRSDRDSRQQAASSIKKSLNNIKIQFKYQDDESKRVTEALIDDMKIAMSLISLSDEEEKRLLDVLEEARKRLHVLFTSSTVIDKSMAGLLHSLEEAIA